MSDKFTRGDATEYVTFMHLNAAEQINKRNNVCRQNSSNFDCDIIEVPFYNVLEGALAVMFSIRTHARVL